jgi:hypothetical protein
MTPVGKDKQRTLSRIFFELFGHQPVQAVEPFAHVARFEGDKHLQAAGKTQHGLARNRTNSAAKAACCVLLTSRHAPPGNSNINEEEVLPSA